MVSIKRSFACFFFFFFKMSWVFFFFGYVFFLKFVESSFLLITVFSLMTKKIMISVDGSSVFIFF